MKQFGGFVTKELYHIFRDYRTLLILFGMPLVQLLLFGFAIRNEINEADIAILDRSKDDISTELVHKLASSGYFRFTHELQHADEIEMIFRQGLARQVLIIEANFGRELLRKGTAHIHIVNDASDPNMANLLTSYTSSIIRDYRYKTDIHPPGTGGVSAEIRMLYNPELESVYMFVPGLIVLVLMLVSALMTSISITREKEFGTMEVLLVSPLKPFQIILGKVLPYLGLAFVIALSILLLSQTVFGVPFKGSVALFLAECVLFIIAALSLGILISTRAKTQQVAMMVSLAGLLMPTILLSGFIFPIANMPQILQLLSNAIPARWFLSIVKGIMLQGLGIEYLWRETAVLAGMTIVFIAAGIRNFNVRLG